MDSSLGVSVAAAVTGTNTETARATAVEASIASSVNVERTRAIGIEASLSVNAGSLTTLVGSGFTPAAIPGLHTWVGPESALTLNGGNVAQWTDMSGVGNHFTMATAGRQPSVVCSCNFTV